MTQAPVAGDLAVELRQLRQRAQREPGGLKVATIATATKVSHQSVYAYLAGTTLPPAEIFDDLLQALGATPGEAKRLWELRDAIEESRRARPEAAPPPEGWPKLVGILPAAADCYVDRPFGTAALRVGPATVVLAGGAGVGKTQAAARLARDLLRSHAVDLLVWLAAPSRDAVISAYARAAEDIGLASADAEDAAGRLHAWLETTTRPWLVVLDDVGDADAVRGLWPPADRGRVIITTRRRDSAIRSGGRQFEEVPPFSPDEALGYLDRKLAGRGETRASLAALAAELGHHPLALAQVCAYIVDRGLRCDEYRARFAERRNQLREVLPEAAALPDDQPTTVDAIWSLSIALADEFAPAGLAAPALAMASVLSGPAIPIDLWTTPAGRAYLGRHRPDGAEVTADQARDSLHNLARLSLVDIDPATSTVSVHALVQAGVRASVGAAGLMDLVRATADALAQAWPDRRDAGVGQILRANAHALGRADEDSLWHPTPHDIVFKVGNSLGDFGHVAAAARYFDDVVAGARARHGDAHRGTVYAQAHRATWLGKRGDAARARDELAELAEQAGLDPGDPMIIEIRGNHAFFVGQAGDYARAIELIRDVQRDCPADALDDASAFALDSNLAFFAGHLGRHAEAADAYRHLLERARTLLGADHLDTVKAWANAIGWRGKAGDPQGALDEFRELLSHVERVVGAEHTVAIRTRFHIARLARECGQPDAVDQLGEILASSERLLGWSHPHTMDIRLECALLSHDRGEVTRAAEQLHELLVDARRVFGEDHPRTTVIEKHLADLRA